MVGISLVLDELNKLLNRQKKIVFKTFLPPQVTDQSTQYESMNVERRSGRAPGRLSTLSVSSQRSSISSRWGRERFPYFQNNYNNVLAERAWRLTTCISMTSFVLATSTSTCSSSRQTSWRKRTRCRLSLTTRYLTTLTEVDYCSQLAAFARQGKRVNGNG